MPGSIEHGSLPFGEQIEFFRGKLNLPTASWTDIFDGQHARAFVVAGAMKDDLLTDLRGAVDKVIADGATLEDFRKDFDALVQRHGWVYNGGRNWRTRVIYHTNLRQSYNTGRWQQQQQVIRTRPFWRYRHSPFQEHPRAEHQAWDGLVLRHDDAFWSTHYPQNAWGCDCDVETLSARDLKRLGKDGPDEAPAIEYEERTVGVRGPNPRTVRVPKGIDPGFGYSPGEAAYGKPLANEVMDGWRAQGAPAWDIEVETDAGRLRLSNGGATLHLDGVEQALSAPGEYPDLYRRFADLIAAGESEVDLAPLIHVSDAFLLGRRRTVEPFHDRSLA